MRADLAAGDAVLDPEAAYAFVIAGQGKAVIGQGVREEGRVEVDAAAVLSGPVHPIGKVLGPEVGALHPFPSGFGIDGV
jgi:hypothetical protein